MNAYNNKFETYMNSGKKDSNGNFIGYIVGFNDNGTDFRAWVQKARLINGEWIDFGPHQKSKSFKNQELATAWAYRAARERAAKI